MPTIFDLTIPFTTDGRIAQNKMIILEDDQNLFPPYNVTFVIRSDTARRLGPNAQRVIERVDDQLTNEVMTELNSRVDLDKEEAADVERDRFRVGHERADRPELEGFFLLPLVLGDADYATGIGEVPQRRQRRVQPVPAAQGPMNGTFS